ncbi:hypothetical protein LJY25_19175 [Hymenobacter sp. BT175]|uniref:hypothetical protein n=1 Tax=Hymenobacter translucens TaxID=2886507 RepID=UPI001D0F3F56|nr:hypothetical protein [Hymenobacter translucens]MCC2548578.1 hypothetical protein [Hymenobacter translucens]
MALAVRSQWRCQVLGAVTVTIGLLVLVQPAHYCYEVLAAPFYAWAGYWLGRLLR